MTDNVSIRNQKDIENRIFSIRGRQIMLDTHLAEMYGVPTKVLNQAVKRNIERFPEPFRFQLTEVELNNCSRSQIVTLNNESKSEKLKRGQNIKYLNYAFTEQGVAMLSAVLRSETAVKISIQIMNAFIEMRKLVSDNAEMFQRLSKIEVKQIEADQKFEQIFKALESKEQNTEKGIFFEGQVYDAYIFVADLIRKAKSDIVLIDNYADDTVLTLLSKRNINVTATIFANTISKSLALDINKHNKQYPVIEIKILPSSHDRFLLLDNKELYHIGASLKDLGKKWFAFSRMDDFAREILNRMNTNLYE